MALRRVLAIPQQAYVDDFLRVGPLLWASLQERAFRRIHELIGIPLKTGKNDLGRSVEALGHRLAATSLWAGLRLTEKRRAGCLQRILHSLHQGFESARQVAELGGHLNFALQATAGRSARAFAATVYEGIVGGAQTQPAPVYRALHWLQAFLQRPPPRPHRMQKNRYPNPRRPAPVEPRHRQTAPRPSVPVRRARFSLRTLIPGPSS